MLVQLERRKEELVGQLKTLADKNTWSEEEQKKVDSLKTELRTAQKELEQRRFIDDLDQKDAASKQPTQPTDFDNMSRRFSLSKVVAHMSGNKQVDIGLEREVSDELAQRSNKKTDGLFMPMGSLEKRTQLTGTTTNITDDNYLPQEFAYPLKDALVTSTLGARVITLQGRGDVKIPTQTSSGSAGWYAENSSITSSDLTFGQRTASMKSLGAIRSWSRQAALQATPEVEMLMRRDLVEVMAEEMDKAALKGGGANEPSGLMTEVSATTRAGDNGSAITMEQIAALPTKLAIANVPSTSRAFLTTERVIAKQRLTRVFTTGDRTVYQNGQLLDERTVTSNLSPLTTNTKGTGTNLRALIYGNWSELYILFWDQIELLINPYAQGFYDKALIQLRATIDASVLVRRPEAFAYYNDIIQA